MSDRPASLQLQFLTIHPDFVQSYFGFGVFRAAQESGALRCSALDLRDYALDKHGSVDDAPYGGGDGMVMKVDVLSNAIEQQSPPPTIISTAPGAPAWTHEHAARYAQNSSPLLFVCGRFGGIDERFFGLYNVHTYSLGDAVYSGGELPALAMADSIVRFLPGALGNQQSARDDSFGDGCAGLLEAPLYTRPAEFRGEQVPAVLMGGNHEHIRRWRQEQSKLRTSQWRPDLLPEDD